MGKKIFLMNLQPKILNFQMALDSIDVLTTKHFTHNPSFEVCMQFFNFMMNIISSQIYFTCWGSPMFVGVFFWLIILSLNLIQYISNKRK